VQGFFSEFIALFDSRTIVSPLLTERTSLVGLCAVCPEISFAQSIFCFTGASSKFTRTEFTALVNRLGGEAVNGVSAKLNYLVIGADGNPCWAYACYGRKVEKAVELRKQGKRIVIVHENDFHDALADHR
jgi:NAD-dependent DNA ligase